ncbi:MAG: hypothetical protein J2P43_01550 [Candidatus Dormibacteraeota bacterium]|nr:hypothetical protein [Candidatus Dormibacteraeota bacterium]
MANPRVVVDFVANTSGLSKGMATAGGATDTFGGRIKSLGKAGLAAAGAAGLAALTATIKTGISEYAESTKVAAQTEAVIKSTGGAANVTAKQVSNLASALMKKTGIDDEAIQSGQNLLLTFTNVQNQAGKGNDVFTQATKIMTDMSVALGQDMKTSAIQVGKALNNPIKGVTALQRVGVSFTDGQKEQIKALVNSGRTMDAQKIILRELNKEFGGSAEAAGKTLPGRLNILRESFNNMAGELVGALVPAFTALLGVFTKVVGALGPLKGALPAIVIAMAGLAALVVTVTAATAVWTAVTTLASAAAKAWTAAQWLLNAALAANPIALVVVAVAALVAAFILAYTQSDKFRAIVQAAFNAVLSVAMAVFNWLKANWPLLLAIITGPIGIAALAIVRNWDTIQSATRSAYNAIANVIGSVLGAIGSAINSAMNAIRGAVNAAWNAIKTATTTVWGAVSGAVSEAAGAVRSALSSLGTWISSFASGAFTTAVNAVKKVFDKIGEGAREALADVKSAMNSIITAITGIVGRVGEVAANVANAIKRPINAVIGAWNSLAIPRVQIKIPSVKIAGKKIGGGSFGFGPFPFPNIPTLAKGGVFDQPTLAMVGEAGREIVTPEGLLRDIVGTSPSVEVRVFLGDQELRGLVRSEVVDANTGLARTLLAGGMA